MDYSEWLTKWSRSKSDQVILIALIDPQLHPIEFVSASVLFVIKYLLFVNWIKFSMNSRNQQFTCILIDVSASFHGLFERINDFLFLILKFNQMLYRSRMQFKTIGCNFFFWTDLSNPKRVHSWHVCVNVYRKMFQLVRLFADS